MVIAESFFQIPSNQIQSKIQEQHNNQVKQHNNRVKQRNQDKFVWYSIKYYLFTKEELKYYIY